METPGIQSKDTQEHRALHHENDIQEFSSVISHRMHYFKRIAMRQLGNVQDAEDAVQEAFLSAYKHLGQFRGHAQLSTWLTTIVINSARMKARGRLRQPHISIDGCDQEYEYYMFSERLSDCRPSPEALFSEQELKEKVEHLSEYLSPILRETFRLRALEELSVRETAEALGVRETAVKARASRARTHLKRMLQKGYSSRVSSRRTLPRNN